MTGEYYGIPEDLDYGTQPKLPDYDTDRRARPCVLRNPYGATQAGALWWMDRDTAMIRIGKESQALAWWQRFGWRLDWIGQPRG